MAQMSDAVKALFKGIFDKTRTGGNGMSAIPKGHTVQITATETSLDENDTEDPVPRVQLTSEKASYDATIYGVVAMRLLLEGTEQKFKNLAHTRELDKRVDVLTLKQYAAKMNEGEHIMDLKFKCLGFVPQANAFARTKSEDKKLNNPVRYTNINYAGYDEYQDALNEAEDIGKALRSATPKLLRSGLVTNDPDDAERIMIPVFQVVA